MSYSDKLGLKFILLAIKGMSKNKLLGTLAICYNAKKEDIDTSKTIEEEIKKEWFKRKYDLKELADYIAVFKGDNNEEKKQ
jgi:hypothetical protein